MAKKGRTIKKIPKLLTEPRDYVVVFFEDEQHYKRFSRGLKDAVEFLTEEKNNAFILHQGRWLKCLFAQIKDLESKDIG